MLHNFGVEEGRGRVHVDKSESNGEKRGQRNFLDLRDDLSTRKLDKLFNFLELVNIAVRVDEWRSD